MTGIATFALDNLVLKAPFHLLLFSQGDKGTDREETINNKVEEMAISKEVDKAMAMGSEGLLSRIM